MCNRSHMVVRDAICGFCYENINYCRCSYTKITYYYMYSRIFSTPEIYKRNVTGERLECRL